MKHVIIVFSLILLIGSCARPSGSESLEGSRPNIILVMTDDQGYPNLSCLGHPVLRTPHIDELYTLSTRFTAFHVSPTCAPTRSAMMSGRHEFKNGVTHTILERERMSLETTTIIEVLKEAGYTSGIWGKWHLGDEAPYQPENRGFDEVFIHGAGGIGQAYESSCADFPTNSGAGRYFNPVIKHNGVAVKTKGFCTDVFFKQALGWIKTRKDGDQPFLAYISTNAPHGPMIAPEKYRQRFTELGYNENLSGYFGMIENIDDNMGLLMSKLKEWDLEDNTLLIFMSDNGQSAGKNVYNAGMKGNKGTTYEGGTRVPAFYYWKGTLTAGADIDKIAAHIDLFPTFAALAGAVIPGGIQEIDGRNLLPLLESPEVEREDRYLFFHKGRWPKGEDPDSSKYGMCAVRSQRFRLVKNSELYDIENDSGEQVNVFDQFPEVVKEMQQAYDDWWKQLGPLMINEDAALSPVRPFFEIYYAQEAEGGIPEWQEPAL
ncbi:MAG: arylsulfatase [Bacteroidales bacterium]|nr:arylsulfatase [Bacteroidales bacterium]